MSSREVIVLGTASQAPTRTRSQNSVFLRWDRYGFLFDPGEGTQRQLLIAGIPSSAITHICITHLHGDHSLGLPGVLQRMSLDDIGHTVSVLYPASGAKYVERLRHATIYDERVELKMIGVDTDGLVLDLDDLAVNAARLDHRVDCFGWRLQEPDGRHMVPERLAAVGLSGPSIGRLSRTGSLEIDGKTVRLEDVSEARPGQGFAFIMDTRPTQAAVELARNADMVVSEATFATSEAQLAQDYSHMTAAQAAGLALEAGARRLVLTHFSQRYPDTSILAAEARAVFPDVIVAEDLMRVSVPSRVNKSG